MSDVAVLHTTSRSDLVTGPKEPGKIGTLQIDGVERTVVPLASEEVSEGVDQFLQEMSAKEAEEGLIPLRFSPHTFEEATVAREISDFQKMLDKPESELTPERLKASDRERESLKQQLTTKNRPLKSPYDVFQSSQARTPLSSMTKHEKIVQASERAHTHTRKTVEREALPATTAQKQIETHLQKNDPQKDKGDGQQHKQEHSKQQEKKKTKHPRIQKAERASKAPTPFVMPLPTTTNRSSSSTQETLGGIDNIFMRFMALMARILGQAEAEAHALYIRIKERTDNIDILTKFLTKVNVEKGEIDWSNNEEMKKLVEKVRSLGVEIPEGKWKWNEDEKKLLKENIQLRKDSFEKITQLERTDMQRYLQEASQCHQARSNILKLLKEVMDTIIHNFRPS